MTFRRRLMPSGSENPHQYIPPISILTLMSHTITSPVYVVQRQHRHRPDHPRAVSHARPDDRRGVREARQLRDDRPAGRLYPTHFVPAGRDEDAVPDHHRRPEFRLRQLARARADRARARRASRRWSRRAFARIFFRNCVATGELYPYDATERLCDMVKTGDVATLDFDNDTLTVNGKTSTSSSRSAKCAR